ncbi:MAG: SAM-dependent methyltransferase, partial [Casimicrobiaceae bacterium]
MNAESNTLDSAPALSDRTPVKPHLPWPARLMLAALRRIHRGRLTIVLPGGAEEVITGREEGPQAVLRIHEPGFARRVLVGSDVAFAEAYRDGAWSTPDLPALLTLLALNSDALGEAYYSRGITDWLLRVKHLLRTNTKRQAKKNIEAHYDLGNAFYRLWLDETMTYSAALFAGEPTRDLASAQNAKYDRILEQLAAPPGAHLLEIGCGWGGFAERAARRGYRLSCVTLSPAQRDYALERIARAGLADRVRIELCDYRDIARAIGSGFDGVVSIEMAEAVGQRYWQAYFDAVARALKPGARAVIQVITIEESRFERYARTSDFIQQYIFPGGMLPSPERFIAHG